MRHHTAEGRLTLDELDERLAKVYAARTLGELEVLTEDLPPLPVQQSPAVSAGASPARRDDVPGGMTRSVGAWASTTVVCFTIWLIVLLTNSDHSTQGWWWLWVAGPTGAALLGRRLGWRGEPTRRRRRRRRSF